MIVIETPRLILRHLTLEDTEALAAIYADPVVMKFFRSVRSLDVTKQKIEKMIESYKQDGFGLWATIYKPNNQFIGRCGLIPQIINQCSELEIAYLLAKEYWGMGLATEAAIAIRDYGFAKIGCNRLISLIDNQYSELEIAYLLAKEYWGMGLATEAAIAIRDYGFAKIGCNRIISLIDHGNVASQKVALKTGLTYEKDIQIKDENLRLYAIERTDKLLTTNN